MLYIILLTLGGGVGIANASPAEQVLQAAREYLERGEISYAFGGTDFDQEKNCEACDQCLLTWSPKPREVLEQCAMCQGCSLDCSHFIRASFEKAGYRFPYLTTRSMRMATLEELEAYGLRDVGLERSRLEPGDLLVYPGHVVMLEAMQDAFRGDIIHATAGRALKGPGLGIQRERWVPIEYFHGPLVRVLRYRNWSSKKKDGSKP